MKTNHEAAFERLREAKPDPISPLPIRLVADFFDEPRARVEPDPTPWVWRPLQMVAVVVLVVGGAIGLIKALGPAPQTELVATSTQVGFNASASELPPTRSMIRGVYRTDDLGTPVSMDLGNVWALERHEPGLIRLGDAGVVTIIRPTGLADSIELQGEDPTFARPPTDLDGWLEGVSSLVTITEVADVGRDGLRVFDLAATEGACPSSAACIPFMSNKGTYEVLVGSSERTRVWWFTMEPFAPLVVVATGPDSTIQNADTLTRSMEFGSKSAHPLGQLESWEAGLDAELPPGRITLPALGGVDFDLPSSVSMRQSNDSFVIQLPSSAQLDIMIVNRAADGTPVTTMAEAMRAIEAMAEVAPAGSLDTLLGEMRVVDIADGPTTASELTLLVPGLKSSSLPDDLGRGWVVPRSGRLWMIEVDDGVLLVSAGVLEDTASADSTLELIELGESVVRTIRLGDS